jgi:hypothetical protein
MFIPEYLVFYIIGGLVLIFYVIPTIEDYRTRRRWARLLEIIEEEKKT